MPLERLFRIGINLDREAALPPPLESDDAGSADEATDAEADSGVDPDTNPKDAASPATKVDRERG